MATQAALAAALADPMQLWQAVQLAAVQQQAFLAAFAAMQQQQQQQPQHQYPYMLPDSSPYIASGVRPSTTSGGAVGESVPFTSSASVQSMYQAASTTSGFASPPLLPPGRAPAPPPYLTGYDDPTSHSSVGYEVSDEAVAGHTHATRLPFQDPSSGTKGHRRPSSIQSTVQSSAHQQQQQHEHQQQQQPSPYYHAQAQFSHRTNDNYPHQHDHHRTDRPHFNDGQYRSHGHYEPTDGLHWTDAHRMEGSQHQTGGQRTLSHHQTDGHYPAYGYGQPHYDVAQNSTSAGKQPPSPTTRHEAQPSQPHRHAHRMIARGQGTTGNSSSSTSPYVHEPYASKPRGTS
jgi:hypothetical protein